MSIKSCQKAHIVPNILFLCCILIFWFQRAGGAEGRLRRLLAHGAQARPRVRVYHHAAE